MYGSRSPTWWRAASCCWRSGTSWTRTRSSTTCGGSRPPGTGPTTWSARSSRWPSSTRERLSRTRSGSMWHRPCGRRWRRMAPCPGEPLTVIAPDETPALADPAHLQLHSRQPARQRGQVRRPAGHGHRDEFARARPHPGQRRGRGRAAGLRAESVRTVHPRRAPAWRSPSRAPASASTWCGSSPMRAASRSATSPTSRTARHSCSPCRAPARPEHRTASAGPGRASPTA